MTEYPEQLDDIGCMVTDSSGRVGMVCNVYTKAVRIQYGQAGPHATIAKNKLRVATAGEIEDAGLEGVGRAWPP